MGKKLAFAKKILVPAPVQTVQRLAGVGLFRQMFALIKNAFKAALINTVRGYDALQNGRVNQKLDYFVVVFGQGRGLLLVPVIVSAGFSTDLWGVTRTLILAIPDLMLILFTFVMNRRVNS
jgi:hypothetical protein